MADAWNILVVDDEEDVHQVTRLALRQSRWRGKPFKLSKAMSAAEAEEMILQPDCPQFHIAMIDCVMETPDAGLKLCSVIREHLPRTIRLVLRTGQPGQAPAEKVLRDHDIDYYLAKSEVTAGRLQIMLHSLMRAAREYETMLAVSQQLQGFAACFEAGLTAENLLELMIPSINFLEDKYDVRLIFFSDLDRDEGAILTGNAFKTAHPDASYVPLRSTLIRLHATIPEDFLLIDHSENAYMTPVTMMEVPGEKSGVWRRLARLFSGSKDDDIEEDLLVSGGVYAQFTEELPELVRNNFVIDLRLFVENWRIAYTTFRMQAALLAKAKPRRRQPLEMKEDAAVSPKLEAYFVGQTAADEMRPSETLKVCVIMKNTGNVNWNGSSGVALVCSGSDVWGTNRIAMKPGEVVAPGQRKDFEFEVKAPDDPGTYTFSWRLQQADSKWFGEKSETLDVTVSPFVAARMS